MIGRQMSVVKPMHYKVWRFDHRNDRKHRQIAGLVEGERVLDIACRESPNPYLTGKVIGVDIEYGELPENYQRLDLVNLNMERLPCESECFDTVIIGDAIEHVENPSFVLREINRVLIKGGKLILSTPNANHWETTIRNWFLWYLPDPDEGEHLSNWTRLDMVRLLKLNGFQTVRQWGTTVSKAIPIYIPARYLPILGFAIIYEARKCGVPKKVIVTRNQDGTPMRVDNVAVDTMNKGREKA